MSIEQEVFANYSIDPARLVKYGFVPEGKTLTFRKPLAEAGFEAELRYDGALTGRVIDLALGEEYTTFRIVNSGGFSGEIRRQFTGLLLDIRDNCCKNQHFRSPQARRVNEFITGTYGDQPEFLWEKLPSYAVYRLKANNKWYGLIGQVKLCKFERGADPDAEVEVLNVKISSERFDAVLALPGCYPAYHMNKKSWISVLLNDTLTDGQVQALIRESHGNV